MLSSKTEDPWISLPRDFMLMLFNCNKIEGCLFFTDMRV